VMRRRLALKQQTMSDAAANAMMISANPQ